MSDEKIAGKKKSSSYQRVMKKLQNDHPSIDFDADTDNSLEHFMNLQKYLFSSETPTDHFISPNFMTEDILDSHFPKDEEDSPELMNLNEFSQPFSTEDNEEFNQENSDLSPEMQLETINKQLAAARANSPTSNYFQDFSNDMEPETNTPEEQAELNIWIDKDHTTNQ